MTEWTVVGVLATLVALFAAVVKPILCLNASLTRLTALLDNLRHELGTIADQNSKSHDRIWQKLSQQEESMALCEHRLTVLEAQENITRNTID